MLDTKDLKLVAPKSPTFTVTVEETCEFESFVQWLKRNPKFGELDEESGVVTCCDYKAQLGCRKKLSFCGLSMVMTEKPKKIAGAGVF